MTNDEAREAALKSYYLGYAPATDQKREVAAYRAAWDACLAHLRATGQLCTVEDRNLIDILDDFDTGDIDGIRRLGEPELADLLLKRMHDRAVARYTPRRAKGEADAG